MEEVMQVKTSKFKMPIEVYELDRKVLFFIFSMLWARLTYQQDPLVLIVPLLALGYYLGSSYFIVAFLGFILGSATLSMWSIMMSALFVVSFFVLAQSIRIFRISLVSRLVIASILAEPMVRVGILWATHEPITPSSLVYVMISLISTFIFLQSGPLIKAKLVEVVEPLPLFLFTLTWMVALLGLQSVDFGGIVLSSILIRLTLLIVARTMGIGLSATLAMSIGIILGAIPPFPLYEFYTLGVATTVASVIGQKGKWGLLLVFSGLTAMIPILLKVDGWAVGIYRETLLAIAVFILIPDRILSGLSRKFPSHDTLKNEYNVQLKRQHQKMQDQMLLFSQMFHSLSNQISLDDDNGMVERHMGHVYRNVCINCPKSRICYQQGDNQLVPLLRKALIQPLTSEDETYLETHCLKPSLLYEVIEQRKRTYISEYRYSKEYQSLKQVLIHHIDGVSSVIDHMKENLSYERSLFQKESENRLKALFERHQMDCLYVRVHDHYHHSEIELSIGGMSEKRIEETVLSLVATVMNQAYKVKEIHTFGNDSYVTMRLEETKLFETVYGVSQVAKDFHASGDTYAVFSQGPYLYAMISDGMGSGIEAQKQSQMTIELIRRMILAGMDRSKALESVNALLKVRNQYDMYATLDMVTIDTMKGRIQLSKNGAPDTWIIRDGKVLIEQGESPPMGIMDVLRFHDHEMELKRGDFIVMMSDGFIPSKETIINDLFQESVVHPQQMARMLLEKASLQSIEDDVTYIVLQIT